MPNRAPEPQPLESNFRSLNEAFYAERPWEYFRQRLVHLAAVASAPGELPFPNPIEVGPLTITCNPPNRDRYPTPGQSFVAIESEVLLHHAAETLLRLVHAHAEPSPCPWMRMSSLTSARVFKEWVKELLRKPGLNELAAQIFGHSEAHPSGPADEAEWIRVFGQHFLDAASYNAAKHGMALGGGAEQRTLTVEDQEIYTAKGSLVSWLAQWPQDESNRPRRWTRASRLFSVEAYVLMIEIAAQLMEGIWTQGRRLHLSEPEGGAEYRPVPPPQALYELIGVPRHVLNEQYLPLAYEGESADLVMHIPVPTTLPNREAPGEAR